MNRAFVALPLLAISACTSPHLYPVCYYEAPPAKAVARAHLPELEAALREVLGGARQVEIAASPDGRWLVTNVTPTENVAAAQAWPRIGCIGNAVDSRSVRAEADCVAYLKDFVANKNYFAFGNARDLGGFDIWHEASNTTSPVYCNSIEGTVGRGKKAARNERTHIVRREKRD